MRWQRFNATIALCLSMNVVAHGNSFSIEMWNHTLPLYAAIGFHPFNRELAAGTLHRDRFDLYEEQDALYLNEFARALVRLSRSLPDPAASSFVFELALDCLVYEKQREGTTAELESTHRYVTFLRDYAESGRPEWLASALLPCFWIYLRLAEEMRASRFDKHPYSDWIERYSSVRYRRSVRRFVEIVDEVARAASIEDRDLMRKVYLEASWHEWGFWEGVYRLDDGEMKSSFSPK